jgi:ATP-binding protein involved in chromosome partitioning
VALADAKKGVSMFLSEAINVPVLGIIENMAYFTEELPDNKYYLFGKKEQKLSRRFRVPFLGGIPIVQSIREAEITVVLQRCKQHLQWRTF